MIRSWIRFALIVLLAVAFAIGWAAGSWLYGLVAVVIALAFSGPLFRNRLEPDYLSRVHEYAAELLLSLKKLGKAGPFWTPE